MINPADSKRIAKALASAPFVKWDRFVDLGNIIRVYGWIDRKKDAYKDFVLLTIDLNESPIVVGYTTSAAEYSTRLRKLFFKKGGSHAKCQRVEDLVKIKNMVVLNKKP